MVYFLVDPMNFSMDGMGRFGQWNYLPRVGGSELLYARGEAVYVIPRRPAILQLLQQ